VRYLTTLQTAKIIWRRRQMVEIRVRSIGEMILTVGQQKYCGENLSRCHSVHHKSHGMGHAIEPERPR